MPFIRSITSTPSQCWIWNLIFRETSNYTCLKGDYDTSAMSTTSARVRGKVHPTFYDDNTPSLRAWYDHFYANIYDMDKIYCNFKFVVIFVVTTLLKWSLLRKMVLWKPFVLLFIRCKFALQKPMYILLCYWLKGRAQLIKTYHLLLILTIKS